MSEELEAAFRSLVRKQAIIGLDEFETKILSILSCRRLDDAIAQRANCPGIPHEICMREERNIVIGADSLTNETVYDTEDKPCTPDN